VLELLPQLHSLPERVSADAAVESVRKAFLSKGWQAAHFSVSGAELSRPFFVYFVFDAFLETQTARGKIVSDTMRGNMALSLPSLSFDRRASDAIAENFAELVPDSSEAAVPGLKGFTSEKLELICRLKSAAELGAEEKNVVVSAITLVLLPVWSVGFSFQGAASRALVSAFDGKILPGFFVPERVKGAFETASETVSGMSSAGGFAGSASEFFSEAAGVVSGRKSLARAFGDDFFVVLLVIAVMVLFAVFFILGI